MAFFVEQNYLLMVTGYGLKITKGYAPNGICAIGALEFIYDKYGHEVLNRILRLVLGTWEGDRMSLSSEILKGTDRMVAVYGDQMEEEMFKGHVGKVSTKTISRTAKDRRPGTLGFADALVMAYNTKNKHRLMMQKLYWNGKKKSSLDDVTEYDEAQ